MLRYLCALIGALVLAVAGLSTAHARGFVPEKSAHGFVTRAGGYTPGHGETPEQSCGQFVQINGFTDPKYWSAVAQYSACMVLYGPNTYVYAVTNVEFPAQCPAWSTKSGAGCTCDAGFKPDASRLPGQYADVETGLFYNYHRNMNSLTGRYMQSDPIGLDGGLNPYQYAESNPLKYTDPLGLYTEVVVWQGVGIGSSSFGHVSTNVNGQNFSWGPGGWDKQSATAAEYNKRQQDFRGGTGVMLNLSPQQEAALASCMRASTAAYSAISNNCGNPVQQCLNAVGAGVGNSVMPSSILENLRSSPNSNGNVSYPSPRPSSGFGGGLLWR